MPPKAAPKATARRGRPKAVRGGKAGPPVTEASSSANTNAEAADAETQDESVAGPSSPKAAVPAISTPQISEDGISPNSSPATVPTETPAPTPARPAYAPILPQTAPNVKPDPDAPSASTTPNEPATQSSVRGGPSIRGGRGGARGGGPKAPSKFKPKAIRSDATKRAELAQKEQERLAGLAAAAANEARKAHRGRGRPARGRGDVMGRPATRGSGGGSGIFGALPESIKKAPNGAIGAPRSGGGSGASGGGDYNPRYPGEDDDAERVNIATINLISDDEDQEKAQEKTKRSGLRPVRLDRHEHQPRVTIVNSGPAIKVQPDDDQIEVDEKRSARPAIKQDPTLGDPGDEVQVKTEPDVMVSFRDNTPGPSGEVEPISPNSRRKVKDRVLSPEPEPDQETATTLPDAKDEKKARRSSKKREQKPVLQTEEDRAEYARYQLDVEVLAKELGGMQGNLNASSKGNDAEGDNMMEDVSKSDDHRTGRVYLFQFPPVLPELYNPVNDNPRTPKIDLTTTEAPDDGDADVEMTGTAPSDKGKGKLKDRTDLIGEAAPPIKLEEEAIPLDKAKKEDVKKGRAPYVNEEGCIGKLVVRKSGRVELSWGGVNLRVGRGVDTGFLTTGIVVDSLEKGPPGGGAPEGRAMSMGQIMGKFVFHALSYTWGPPGTNHEVICDGQSMWVTTNLFSALTRIRSQSGILLLWIDDVCINQQDVREKESQVYLMSLIYSQATSVIADLGDSLCAELFSPLLLQLQQAANEDSETAVHPYAIYTRYKLPRRNSLAWKAWGAVITSPWFERAWSMQEFTIAKEVRMMSGCYEVSWPILYEVFSWIAKRGDVRGKIVRVDGRDYFGEPFTELVNLRQDVQLGRPRSMQHLCTIGLNYRATDPRDKAYSLISLTTTPEISEIEVDYSEDTSVAAVYHSMARVLVSEGNYMAILCRAGGARHTEGLPSWVPEWNYPVTRLILSNYDTYDPGKHNMQYRAAGETKPIIAIGQNGTLDIQGVFVCKIAGLAPVMCEFTKDAYFEYEQDVKSMIASIDDYPTGESVREAYWKTSSGYKTCTNEVLPADFESSYEAFERYKVVRGDEEMWLALPFMTAAIGMALGRRFCILDSGCFGMVPKESKFGDLIAVFLGAQTPSVLRRDSGGYKFIGECYVHGLMEGAALELDHFHVETIVLK
ncbi:hypothetical protein VTL71DRAFT_97 [Oculimacula yallundae]|uniref:Ig-like domain-containing protein n=1 Tax=Oculimacula yallundae TaxID=86028 RepID=A0ABR4CZ60_9HELO